MNDGLASWAGPAPPAYFPREQQQFSECEFLRVHVYIRVNLYYARSAS